MFVSVGVKEDTPAEVSVNHSLVSGYLNAMKEISETYGIENDAAVVSLSRFPDVFTVHKAPEDEEKITADVLSAAQTALDSFIVMRVSRNARPKPWRNTKTVCWTVSAKLSRASTWRSTSSAC